MQLAPAQTSQRRETLLQVPEHPPQLPAPRELPLERAVAKVVVPPPWRLPPLVVVGTVLLEGEYLLSGRGFCYFVKSVPIYMEA